MKNLFAKSIIFVTLLAAFYSCSGGGEEINKTPLTVSNEAIETSVLGETKTITMEAPGDWKATTTGDKWITITPSSGKAGKTDVKITISPNESEKKRSAEIMFTSDKESKSVKVTQKWEPFFMLPCKEYTIGYGGGDIIIGGLPERGFTINIPTGASQWVHSIKNTLSVLPNVKDVARSAVISITDGINDKSYEVFLIQECIAGGSDGIFPIKELVIDDYSCPSNSQTLAADFLYSVDDEATTTTKTAKVEFSGEGIQWITIGDDPKKIYSGDTVTLPNMTPGAKLTIYSHNSAVDRVGENTLMITSLPIVTIYTSSAIKDEPKVDCNIAIFDPKKRTDAEEKNLEYFESKAGIEYRGAGAQRYIKKPYNFKLYDSTGEKREAELLNIRNDNSWILDAMYLDVAHMRNRVCFDIWNQFNKPYYVSEKPKAMSGTRGHHVEVFINGEYMGLFVLSDRIDRKQYQIEQQGGYIYKAKGWTNACRLKGCTRSSNNDYYWNSAEIEQEYPGGPEDGEPNFDYLAEMIEFVAYSNEEDFSKNFEEHFDMSSVVDAFIFLNMIVADDNIGRNTFWILRNVNESKKFIHGLWDLDGTLGRNWDRHQETPEQAYADYLSGWVVGHGNNGESTRFYFHERIIKENPANIHQKIYDRWNEIKDGALAPSNFNQIVDGYAELMISSGARDREVKRWKSLDIKDQPNWRYETVYFDNVDQEAAYMKDWWQKRHAKLNSLINELEHK